MGQEPTNNVTQVNSTGHQANLSTLSITFLKIYRSLNPTNHATIQSLVHAIGAQPDVPAPCCVPDHLSPMTLLYMDEAGNVVLKNYPSMTVDSCACR
uniref:TGF-beta family profile domain-containing protein n=1 Tax=Timema cristinae TaxID=61476 RepID=A0A7R9CCX7_TIMCR|nr:unnamed protein product [Timema cristinae]